MKTGWQTTLVSKFKPIIVLSRDKNTILKFTEKKHQNKVGPLQNSLDISTLVNLGKQMTTLEKCEVI